MDEACVDWPVMAVGHTLRRLLAAREDAMPAVRQRSERGLRSARYGDTAAVDKADNGIINLNMAAVAKANRTRSIHAPLSVPVGSSATGASSIWHRCGSLDEIERLGKALDNCLQRRFGDDAMSHRAILGGRTTIWWLEQAGEPVLAALVEFCGTVDLLQVRSARNGKPNRDDHRAIQWFIAWHRAHVAESHSCVWRIRERDASFMHLDQADLHFGDGLRMTLAEGDDADRSPANLPRNTATRHMIRTYTDPARDWALQPPRLSNSDGEQPVFYNVA